MSVTDENVFFLKDFDDSMEDNIVVPLIVQIQKQRALRDGRIDLHINSYGGYRHLVFQLVSLVETAKRAGVVVRTIVPDVAYSAGSILAIAGTPGERYIEKTGEHLMHYGSSGAIQSTPEQASRNFIQADAQFKRIRNHYEKYTEVDPKELDRLMNDDSAYIPAAKCIKWKLADHYMEKFDIGTR